MVMTIYDSQGMAHNVPVKLEKVAANSWEVSFENIFGKTSTLNSNEEAEALENYYSYIEESDGTYTRVQLLQKSDEEPADGESESFANVPCLRGIYFLCYRAVAISKSFGHVVCTRLSRRRHDFKFGHGVDVVSIRGNLFYNDDGDNLHAKKKSPPVRRRTLHLFFCGRRNFNRVL